MEERRESRRSTVNLTVFLAYKASMVFSQGMPAGFSWWDKRISGGKKSWEMECLHDPLEMRIREEEKW